MPRLAVPRVVVILAWLFLLAPPAVAQTTTSTIEGTVTDTSGAVIPGAEVTVRGTTLAAERRTTTDAKGVYRLTALPAGTYTVTVTATGLAASSAAIEVTLNRVVTFDVTLQVGGVQETIAVSTPALDPSTSATGATITPREITELPVNGRNYLDLLQLVPGVAINRQVDPNNDRSNPVLGERSGNNNFLIDGQSNKDTVNGGPAQQFNQETIAEFQVLTSGYKAEFGQASGAIVNVITKSGSNLFNGVGSLFFRNDALDTSNSLDDDENGAAAAAPLRLEPGARRSAGQGQGVLLRVGGAHRREPPAGFQVSGYRQRGRQPAAARRRKRRTMSRRELSETRAFVKFDERFGQHQLSQQVNYTDGGNRSFLPLSSANSLPSARNDTDTTRLLVGIGDTRVAGQSRQPLCRDAPRRDPAREQRDASVTVGFHRVDALQSL